VLLSLSAGKNYLLQPKSESCLPYLGAESQHWPYLLSEKPKHTFCVKENTAWNPMGPELTAVYSRLQEDTETLDPFKGM
jgi:hypothetical protein